MTKKESAFDTTVQVEELAGFEQLDDNTENLTPPHRKLVVSDPHGAKSFEPLMRHIIGMEDDELFTVEDVAAAMDRANIGKIRVLGDLLDRAEDPIAVFEQTEVLEKTERMGYVSGNHDIYFLAKALKIDIPYYEGYPDVAKDYTMTVLGRPFKPAEWLEQALNDAEPGEGVRNPFIWAKVISDYKKNAAERQASMWDDRYRDLRNSFAETYGAELVQTKIVNKETVESESGDDILNYPEKYATNDNMELKTDDELCRWWSEILGRGVGVMVNTGMRATEKMSINWWLERYQTLGELRQKYPEREELWQKADAIISRVITEYQATLNTKMVQGNYMWLFEDAIMNGNYETLAWNADDWLYHTFWGSTNKGLLAKRNDQLAAREEDDGYRVDNVNWTEDELIQKMLDFHLKNFNLYDIDEDGNLYMHSMLPLDEDGDIAIGYVNGDGKMVYEEDGKRVKGIRYNGKEYQGREVFKCFDEIVKDIRSFDRKTDSPLKLHEALSLVVSMYADRSTLAKPKTLAANLSKVAEKNRDPEFVGPVSVGAGQRHVLDQLGIEGVLFCGHNPQNKLWAQGIQPVMLDENGLPVVSATDNGMAPAFKGQPLAVEVDYDCGIVEYRRNKQGEFVKRTVIPPEGYKARLGIIDITELSVDALMKYHEDIYDYSELWPRKDFPDAKAA
jgi:hypothetical protein